MVGLTILTSFSRLWHRILRQQWIVDEHIFLKSVKILCSTISCCCHKDTNSTCVRCHAILCRGFYDKEILLCQLDLVHMIENDNPHKIVCKKINVAQIYASDHDVLTLCTSKKKKLLKAAKQHIRARHFACMHACITFL